MLTFVEPVGVVLTQTMLIGGTWMGARHVLRLIAVTDNRDTKE